MTEDNEEFVATPKETLGIIATHLHLLLGELRRDEGFEIEAIVKVAKLLERVDNLREYFEDC